MPDQEKPDQNDMSSESDALFNEVPVEDDLQDEEALHPRRSASAEFVVDAKVGSASVLRDAMDPANQSLADALKLTYKVLVLGIFVLIILFLGSGFKTIDTSQTGIRTLFGKIQGESGSQALQPGLAINWFPYPASDFIIFTQRIGLAVNETFWPDNQIGQNGSYEKATDNTANHGRYLLGLGRGKDGYLLLSDGIGHLQMQATYSIDRPEQFVQNVIGENEAKRIVELALQRAAVHELAKMNLKDAINQEDLVANRILLNTKTFLKELHTGINIDRLEATNIQPPLAIYRIMRQLNTTSASVSKLKADAILEKNNNLLRTAGQAYSKLLILIEEYEKVLLSSELGARDPEAESILSEIEKTLESDDIGGEVAQMIEAAKSHKDYIQATLGALANRFLGLLSQYRANPEFVVSMQWMETYERVLGAQTAEKIFMPASSTSIIARVKTSNDVMQARRAIKRQLRENLAYENARGAGSSQLGLFERNMTRRLQVGDDGSVVGRGQGRQ